MIAARVARSAEVHLHRPGELVVAGAQEAIHPQPDGADVVDQHVDPTVLVDRALEQQRRAVRGDEVERHRGHAVDVLQGVDRARPRDHASALVGERPRDGQSDALAGAGDDGDPVGELQVHQPRLTVMPRATGAASGSA